MMGLWQGPRALARRPRRAAPTVAALAPAVSLVGLAVLLGLGATACGGNRPVARGYESHELYPIRTTSLGFNGANGPGVVVFQTSDDGGTNYWTVDLSTGAAQSYGNTFPPPPAGSTPPPPAPYLCAQVTDSGSINTSVLQITDAASGVVTTIPDVINYAQCPGADGNLLAFVAGDDGSILFERGPYTALQPVSLGMAVTQVGYWAFDASNAPATVSVWGVVPPAPGQVGFYTIDLTSYAITTDIPAVPASTAWASGATPAGSLASTSVSGNPLSLMPFGGDHYIYPREMSDGGTTIFAGPFSSGPASELALFQIPPGTSTPAAEIAAPSPAAAAGAMPVTLVSWILGPPANQLVIWDDANRRVSSCSIPPSAYIQGVQSPDGTKVLFGAPQAPSGNYQSSAGGPLLLLSIGAGAGGTDTCASLVSANVTAAGFSPDGDFLDWVVQPPTGEAQLWVAASDGSGAHMVGTGVLQNVHFIMPGDAQLEMILGGDLVWMDLHDSSVNLHYVAQNVFDLIYDLRDGWLIAGYEYSSQNTNGTLGLVNRNTGEKRPISPEVAQFTVFSEALSADGGYVSSRSDAAVSFVLSVVYQVHGRNPSSQDGIWVATITAADLQ